VPTDSGLPGWFPGDFNADGELLSAFEQPARASDMGRYTWQPGDIQLADNKDSVDGEPADDDNDGN
jgi:hypothetical protein